MSKWEWIAKVCESDGLKESAVIAIEMENLLIRIYGNTTTEAWEEDYKYFVSLSTKEIDRVVRSCEYCIGCEHSNENGLTCNGCLLSLEDFECVSEKSLFKQFCDTYEKEKNR